MLTLTSTVLLLFASLLSAGDDLINVAVLLKVPSFGTDTVISNVTEFCSPFARDSIAHLPVISL